MAARASTPAPMLATREASGPLSVGAGQGNVHTPSAWGTHIRKQSSGHWHSEKGRAGGRTEKGNDVLPTTVPGEGAATPVTMRGEKKEDGSSTSD